MYIELGNFLKATRLMDMVCMYLEHLLEPKSLCLTHRTHDGCSCLLEYMNSIAWSMKCALFLNGISNVAVLGGGGREGSNSTCNLGHKLYHKLSRPLHNCLSHRLEIEIWKCIAQIYVSDLKESSHKFQVPQHLLPLFYPLHTHV